MGAASVHASPEAGGMPFDPLEGLDECARALVTRLVVDQKLPLSHRSFHQVQNTFEKLGIRFEKSEREIIPLKIDPHLVSYEAMAIHRVFRGDVVTEYISVETRMGAPGILARRVNDKAFWHSDQHGFFGVLEGARADHGLTRGLAELQFLWLESAGSGPTVRQEIARLDSEGLAHQRELAEEALAFYLRNLVRRAWSEETKKRLSKEFFDSLRHSVLSISRLRTTGDIVGIFQTIRAPYGRRVVAREKGDSIEIVSDEVGAWGDSVRKFGIKSANVHYLSNQEIYDRMNANRDENGELPLIRPPVEIKMREQGRQIRRDCPHDSQERVTIDGEPHIVFWGSGEVDEPARLAVDRSQNPHLFVEVLTQLLTTAIDPHFSMDYNLNNRRYFTYNDRPSLYYCVNFRDTGDFLSIDGKPWSILSSNGADHISALKTVMRPLEEEDATQLEQIKSAVIRYMDGAE
jgi:hypothetical protein